MISGSGYSSLITLFYAFRQNNWTKVSRIKFKELENIKFMDSLIALAHGLNLKVVTEGVEKIEEFEKMKIAGSDYLQGYLFSKPIKNEEVEKIFNRNYMDLLSESIGTVNMI